MYAKHPICVCYASDSSCRIYEHPLFRGLYPARKLVPFYTTLSVNETDRHDILAIVLNVALTFITTDVTSGAGTAYPSGTPEFTPGFKGFRVTRSLVLCLCFVDRCLSLCTFFALSIVLSVLLRYTDSDCPFGIFKLF